MRSKSDFTIDLTPLIRQYEKTPAVIAEGAKSAMHDILDFWQAEARDRAPHKTGSLKREIEQILEGDGINLEAKMTNNVYNNNFNYGYWQHNVRGGTGLKYIDNVANENKEKWLSWIEQDIRSALKRSGW